jgi:urease accessory protein
MKKLLIGSSTIAALAMVPTIALAHPGSLDHIHGLTDGIMHPLTGLDHVLAMVAVGLLAAQLGGRALWITPLSFMAMLVVGALLAMAHIAVPLVEIGIAFSIISLGLVLLFGVGLPTVGAMALVGFFAIFHGYAHGLEVSNTASALSYGVGFVLATGLLHLAGITLGLFARRAAVSLRPGLFRAAGATFTFAGIALLIGAFSS